MMLQLASLSIYWVEIMLLIVSTEINISYKHIGAHPKKGKEEEERPDMSQI
jgi:hypothetical protein